MSSIPAADDVLDPDESVYDLAAVSALLGISVTKVHQQLRDGHLVGVRRKVHMVLDAEVDGAYPQRWIGKVTVETNDGRRLEGRVDEPKGDPGNTLTPEEIEDKAVRLARYRDGATADEMRRAFATIRALPGAPRVGRLLA